MFHSLTTSPRIGDRLCSSITHVMVLCATCRVNTIDRHCTNTPRSCYQCCTSHVDILTCPLHFQQMGISDAAARLASGRVHANIAEDAEAGLPSVPAPPPAPPGGESPPPGRAIPAQPVADSQALSSPVVMAPVPPVVVPPSLTLSSVAASVVDVAASVVDVAASVAAIRASLAAITAAIRPQAAQAAAPAPAAHAAEPLRASPAPSPPHQAAILDRAAATSRSEVAQLVSRFSALANDDDSDDEAQVRHQSHTHTGGAQPSPTTLLPAAFVPTPSGSEQSAQQQLAAIVNEGSASRARRSSTRPSPSSKTRSTTGRRTRSKPDGRPRRSSPFVRISVFLSPASACPSVGR